MELQAVGEPESAEEVHQHRDDLGVQGRMSLAERLDVGLMKLAVAPGLGALVAKHGPHGVEPHGLGLDVESVLDVGAQH